MNKQAVLEKIEQRIKVSKGQSPAVTLSLNDWRIVEDLILELSAPKLLRSITKAREDFRNKKGKEYKFGNG